MKIAGIASTLVMAFAFTVSASAQEVQRPVLDMPSSPVKSLAGKKLGPSTAFGALPRPLPPEAFTTPSNYILVVNLDGAVDDQWLTEECELMKKQLRVSVVAEKAEGETGSEPRKFIEAVRARHEDKAKIVLVLSKETGLTPILTAPYEYWVVMDAGWVKAGGGDDATVNLRMGKRLFQALGHCIGAGYRQEREAVMRYTPTPAALDDCLSHGFHPLNSNIFFIVQKAIGLDDIRLRPRKELIDMGILKPRAPASTEPTATVPAEAEAVGN